jgi:hypothetical protein
LEGLGLRSFISGALVDVVEREPARGHVPEWPWHPVAGLLRVVPPSVVRRLTGS